MSDSTIKSLLYRYIRTIFIFFNVMIFSAEGMMKTSSDDLDYYINKKIFITNWTSDELKDSEDLVKIGNGYYCGKDYLNAYICYKQAICGNKKTKHSKIFTDYIDISIEAYCACKNLCPLTKTQFGFREIRSGALSEYFEAMGFVLVDLVQKEISAHKAIRFQKEAMFWLRFKQDDNFKDLVEEIYKQQEKLCNLMK